uniref:V-type proton ATPase subunit G n=1 Tax=Ornithorhynchus anatinus TaxID=9258 RepID=A0A6I8NR48_ORNAN
PLRFPRKEQLQWLLEIGVGDQPRTRGSRKWEGHRSPFPAGGLILRAPPPPAAQDLKRERHRNGKNRRLKQAKEEAQAEIEQYRLQREKEFKAKEAAALGSHGSCTTEVEKETQEKMVILQGHFDKNREEVLVNLLAFVCDIQPQIHENYRING